MAHITQKLNPAGGKFALALIQWSSYTVGGEQFTLAEFGLTAPLVDFWALQTHGDNPENSSQYLDLSQVKATGKVRVMAVGGPDQEQPTGPLILSALVVVQGT